MKPSVQITSSAKLVSVIPFVIAAVFASYGPSLAQSSLQSKDRSIENKVPSHVPLAIRIKPAKVGKVKDPGNKNWFRDLELEITNTSEKPVYYLNLFVKMADVHNASGASMVFPIVYGRVDFVDFNVKPVPQDLPLLPGQTFTFQLPEKSALAWEAWLRRNNKSDAMILEILFNHLSFGDGTGFVSLDALPFPFKAAPE